MGGEPGKGGRWRQPAYAPVHEQHWVRDYCFTLPKTWVPAALTPPPHKHGQPSGHGVGRCQQPEEGRALHTLGSRLRSLRLLGLASSCPALGQETGPWLPGRRQGEPSTALWGTRPGSRAAPRGQWGSSRLPARTPVIQACGRCWRAVSSECSCVVGTEAPTGQQLREPSVEATCPLAMSVPGRKGEAPRRPPPRVQRAQEPAARGTGPLSLGVLSGAAGVRYGKSLGPLGSLLVGLITGMLSFRSGSFRSECGGECGVFRVPEGSPPNLTRALSLPTLGSQALPNSNMNACTPSPGLLEREVVGLGLPPTLLEGPHFSAALPPVCGSV